MKLTGNTILVTGSTSGIGLALALRLHDSGNKVIIAGRRRALLDQITTDHPGIDSIELDVADPESIARARESVAVSHPELNVLVNNAGIMQIENVLDPAGLQSAEDQVSVNLLGAIRATYAFVPLLAGKDGAAIINVTSALAFVPLPATPTYSATKAALHSFTDSLRVQLSGEETDIQVIEMAPPGVQTDLLGQKDNPGAMPLDDFITEVWNMLEANPNARELVVDSARPMRDAEASGTYQSILASLSGM